MLEGMRSVLFLGLYFFAVSAETAEADLQAKARQAVENGIRFFHQKVAVQGTYLWQYSADLTQREGEGRATGAQGWVQPPGTPAVGMALLKAWQATSNDYFLEAGRETAYGLIGGQLESGGWHYAVDFSPEGRKKAAYRHGGKKTAKNVTTFDDDTTQASLRFLMHADKALGFSDSKIGEAVEYCIEKILRAQYPNGSWPQGYDRFPDPKDFPVLKSSFPDSWSRAWPGSKDYWYKYTLNDNALSTLISTLLEAEQIYGVRKLGRVCRQATEKAGNFLLLAQMPEPQPAWAQQYDFEMHPTWARKFEPPAISGGESQQVLRTLIRLYSATGDRKYLDPIPRALAYLRRSRLPDGRLARFYELKTNRPLYFTRGYELTHSDADVPTHYAFKVEDNTDAIEREYERVRKAPSPQKTAEGTSLKVSEKEILALIAAQDGEGRWLEEGVLRHFPKSVDGMIIRSATFIKNIETLSRYLASPK